MKKDIGLQTNEFLSLGDSVQTGRSTELHYCSAEKPSITHNYYTTTPK